MEAGQGCCVWITSTRFTPGPKLPWSCLLPLQICSSYNSKPSCEGTICFLSPLETCRDHFTSSFCPKAQGSARGVQGWRGSEGSTELCSTVLAADLWCLGSGASPLPTLALVGVRGPGQASWWPGSPELGGANRPCRTDHPLKPRSALAE